MFTNYLAIGLKVADYEKTFSFYKNVLGFSVKTEDATNKFAELQFGNLVIALLTNETVEGMCGEKELGSPRDSPVVIAMEVDSLEQTYKTFLQKGVTFIIPPKTTPWGQKVSYMRDIEGYVWELSEKFEEQ